MKVAIIGTGFIANTHVAILQSLGHDVFYVVHKTIEKAVIFAKKWEIPNATTDFQAAINHCEVIHICTPPLAHFNYAKEAILAKSTAAGDRQQSMRALFEPQQLDALLDHELWKPLASDLNTALRHLVDNNNENDELRVSQAISRICIEQESKILEAMISAADQPVLPVHDCLVTRVPNDVNKITDTVEELTEISIRLDTEQYSEWT